MLVDFVNCGNCECQECQSNHSCPKTDMYDNPCIDCQGMPPYAPWETPDDKLHEVKCDSKKSRIISMEVPE